MKNTQIYNYAIPANGAVQILTEGSYFRILSATGPVEVDADTYGNIVVLAGQGVKDQPFRRLFLNDKSGAINNISLLVSDGSFVDDRITGEVSVIDGGLARTISNTAFSSVTGTQPATVTNNAGLQLFNNAAVGGKNMIVEQIFMHSNIINLTAAIRLTNTALTTLFGSAVSKLANGAASSIAQLKYAENTAWPGNVVAFIACDTASKTVVYTPKEPLVIPPQYGVTVHDNATTLHQMFATFEHYEQQP